MNSGSTISVNQYFAFPGSAQDISHSREEWNHVLNTIKRYEIFCEKNEIANGVIEENSSYLRELHKQLLNEHRI